MARRNDHSREEIKKLALEAALDLVIQQGHKSISGRKIASEIGYTVGTLYQVFNNLDDLIMQVNAITLEQMLDWLMQKDNTSLSGTARIKLLAQNYLDYVAQHTQQWHLLELGAIKENDHIPDWYMHKINQLFQFVESVLQNEMLINQEEMLVSVSRVLWASIHGICLLTFSHRLDVTGGLNSRQMSELLIENFVAGYHLLQHN